MSKKNIIDTAQLDKLLNAIGDVVYHQVDEDYCLMCDETDLGKDIVYLKEIRDDFIKKCMANITIDK